MTTNQFLIQTLLLRLQFSHLANTHWEPLPSYQDCVLRLIMRLMDIPIVSKIDFGPPPDFMNPE
jgi:hypothetical protein